jgi:hypothetical protein
MSEDSRGEYFLEPKEKQCFLLKYKKILAIKEKMFKLTFMMKSVFSSEDTVLEEDSYNTFI